MISRNQLIKSQITCVFLASLALVGCATMSPNTYVMDYNGYTYYQYKVEIISNPPGAKIEINNDYVGDAPITRTVNGNWGMLADTIIRAIPTQPGQFVQTKYLPGTQPFPSRIYFDMSLGPVQPNYNVNVNTSANASTNAGANIN